MISSFNLMIGSLGYGVREDRGLPAALRADFFAFAIASVSFILESSFFSRWMIWASLAFVHLEFSRLVWGMLLLLQAWMSLRPHSEHYFFSRRQLS